MPNAYSETMGNILSFCPVVRSYQYCEGDATEEKKIDVQTSSVKTSSLAYNRFVPLILLCGIEF